MYVAMTRAKNTTYFVHKTLEPSNFIAEIIEICKNNNIKHKEHVYRDNVIMPCSECLKNGRDGGMRIRTITPIEDQTKDITFSFHVFYIIRPIRIQKYIVIIWMMLYAQNV